MTFNEADAAWRAAQDATRAAADAMTDAVVSMVATTAEMVRRDAAYAAHARAAREEQAAFERAMATYQAQRRAA